MKNLLLALAALSTLPAMMSGPAAEPRRFVALDGSAPYTSIQAAIDSVTGATREHPVEIVVKPGRYFEMFTTKDWVNVTGTDRDTCIVTYDRKPEEPNHKTHVVWATSHTTLRNLTLVGRDVKYCIHSDGGRDYVLTIENCVLRREYPENYRGSRMGFGVGLHARQHIVVRKCRIEADVSLFLHNWDRQKASSSFTVADSVLTGVDEAIIVHTLGSGQRDYLVLHDNVLHGAKAAIRYVNTERKAPRAYQGADEIEIFASGNTLRAPVFGARVTEDAAARLSGLDRSGGSDIRPSGGPPPAGTHRAIFRVPARESAGTAPRVIKLPIDFHAWMRQVGEAAPWDQYSLRVAAVDGATPGREIPFRLDPRWNVAAQTYGEAGDLAFALTDPSLTQFAVHFGSGSGIGSAALAMPVIGDGDFFRLAGDGRTTFSAPAAYPCVVDFDGDGRRDLIGSDRYGTDARVVWFRNIGTDTAPAFSPRETFPLQTADGKDISNPNRGWMLTPVLCDWDGDGRRDLLVGGWCRYLTFHKNIGTAARPVFAAGRRIFDAKVFPGLDYGRSADTPYQGVFIEPCDWDGDGTVDLLCGSYMRGRIFFLRGTGRDSAGLPILAPPVALSAGGSEIDFLAHGKPSVGDWDGDGDLDLMSGQYYQESTPARGTGAFGCYLFENIGSRTRPELAKGVHLRDTAGKLVWTGFHSAVTMVDWNLDGRMDVFACGMKGSALYLNQGAPGKPALVPTAVPAVGQAPARVSNFAYPIVNDLDADGTLDLIVGDGDGYVHFFRGVGGQQFAAPVKIRSGGREIHEVGCPDGGEADLGYVKVAIADWNRDGHPDLIMWSNNGYEGWQRGSMGPDNWCLKFFPGTSDPLNFGAPSEIQAQQQHIMAGYRAKPDVVDLDGDGLLDLVVAGGNGKVNGSGSVMFFRNLSAPAAAKDARPGLVPPLAAGVPLTTTDGQAIAASVRTAVRLADWDGDGDLDLFTGNHNPVGLRYWENVGSKTGPVFAVGKALPVVNETVKSHHEIGIDVVAFDGGSKPDLVIGNGDSGVSHLFRRSYLEARPAPELMRIEPKPRR